MENARLIDRDARGLGAADRDRRGIAGHQLLARRPRAGVRRDAGKGACACASVARHFGAYDGEHFRAVATWGGASLRRNVPAGVFRVSPATQSCGDPRPNLSGRAGRSHRGSREQTRLPRRYPVGACRGRRSAASGTLLCVPLRKDDTLLGLIRDLSPRGAAVHRQADRAVAEFRGAGGDRDGERAADHRDARGLGAADRDRRGLAGHQFLARRSRAGVRCDARKGACASASVASARSVAYGRRTFRAVAMRGVRTRSRSCCARPFDRRTGAPLERLLRGRTHCPYCRYVAKARLSAGRSDARSALVDLGGSRTVLFVPLRKDDGLLGAYRRLSPGGAAVHRQSRSRCCRTSRRRR